MTKTPPKTRSLAPTLLASIAGGLETTVVLWILWLAVHLPAVKSAEGLAAPSGPALVAFGVALVATIALGCLAAPPRTRLVIGICSGIAAAVLNLLLLGSLLGETADSTEALADAGATFREHAPMVLLGFLASCAVGGLIAGGLASVVPVRGTRPPTTRGLVARLMIPLLAVLVCLISVGGAVTSTNAGLAVPDAVTTYGRLPWLYPLELMADPRIFLEHTHRLFGWLAGVSVFTVALAALITNPRKWWIGVGVGLILLAFAAGAIGIGHATILPESASLVLAGLVGIALLLWTALAALVGRTGHASFGLGCLIGLQGMFGIIRVSEALTWMAAFHGLFAQAILCTAALLAVRLAQRARGSAIVPPRKVAWITLGVLGLQILLGVLTRHFGHPAFTGLHMVWSLAATAFVIILGVVLMRDAPAEGPGRRPVRAIGGALHGVVFVQFLLGWWALALVGHGSTGDLPTAETLATTELVPVGEALVTTAHQALGAILVGCVGAAMGVAGRPSRAGDASAGAEAAPAPTA